NVIRAVAFRMRHTSARGMPGRPLPVSILPWLAALLRDSEHRLRDVDHVAVAHIERLGRFAAQSWGQVQHLALLNAAHCADEAHRVPRCESDAGGRRGLAGETGSPSGARLAAAAEQSDGDSSDQALEQLKIKLARWLH